MERIFVALDTADRGRALHLVSLLRGRVGGFKIGLELFCAWGPSVVREVVLAGEPVFLDLKLHDIPATVAGAAAAAARLGVSYLTVHALGGPVMMRRGVVAAAEAAQVAGLPPPAVLAVTILTSHGDAELGRIGLAASKAAEALAALAREAGTSGIVCSPLEIAAVRAVFPEATLVVPGIRPVGSVVRADDQQRTATAAQALSLGASYLVIGRPITEAADPVAAAAALARDIELGEAR